MVQAIANPVCFAQTAAVNGMLRSNLSPDMYEDSRMEQQGTLSRGLTQEMPPITLGETPAYVYVLKMTLSRTRGKAHVVQKMGVMANESRWSSCFFP